MPRVHTAKAGKDYPKHDIKKGDVYYHWAFFRGPKMMSKTPPRRSQTTGSSKLSTLYGVEESLQDALAAASCPADVVSALDDAISGAESSVEEYEDAISNLEDGFPNGCPAIEETQEARDNIESWKDELESAKSEVEGLDDFNKFDDLSEEKQEELLTEARDLAEAVSLEV